MFMSKKFLFQLIIWYRFSQCLSNSFIIYNFVKFKLHWEYLLSSQWGYILPYWKPNSMLRFSPLFQADSLSPERFLFTLIFKKNTRNISSSLYLTKFEKMFGLSLREITSILNTLAEMHIFLAPIKQVKISSFLSKKCIKINGF